MGAYHTINVLTIIHGHEDYEMLTPLHNVLPNRVARDVMWLLTTELFVYRKGAKRILIVCLFNSRVCTQTVTSTMAALSYPMSPPVITTVSTVVVYTLHIIHQTVRGQKKCTRLDPRFRHLL